MWMRIWKWRLAQLWQRHELPGMVSKLPSMILAGADQQICLYEDRLDFKDEVGVVVEVAASPSWRNVNEAIVKWASGGSATEVRELLKEKGANSKTPLCQEMFAGWADWPGMTVFEWGEDAVLLFRGATDVLVRLVQHDDAACQLVLSLDGQPLLEAECVAKKKAVRLVHRWLDGLDAPNSFVDDDVCWTEAKSSYALGNLLALTFEQSWNDVMSYLETDEKWQPEVALLSDLMTRGSHRRLRLGASLFQPILTRCRRHGFAEQSWRLKFSIYEDGRMEVSGTLPSGIVAVMKDTAVVDEEVLALVQELESSPVYPRAVKATATRKRHEKL